MLGLDKRVGLFAFLSVFLSFVLSCLLSPFVPELSRSKPFPYPARRMEVLDVERGGLGLGQVRLVRLQRLLNLGGGELLHLLGSAADEGAGVQEAVELIQDRGEEGGAADAVQEVVVLALLLDVVGGLVGEDTWRRGKEIGLEMWYGMVWVGLWLGLDVRISSWASWRERPFFTQAMIT